MENFPIDLHNQSQSNTKLEIKNIVTSRVEHRYSIFCAGTLQFVVAATLRNPSHYRSNTESVYHCAVHLCGATTYCNEIDMPRETSSSKHKIVYGRHTTEPTFP